MLRCPQSFNFMQNSTLILWCFLDGKPGHQKQSFGLIQGLQTERNIHVETIPLSGSVRQRLKQTQETCASLARKAPPHLLVGTGHACHLPVLLARHRHGGRAIILMKPSLPSCFFDFVLIPKHDQPKENQRVIATEGALSPVKQGVKSSDCGLILIGGPDKRIVWNTTRLWQQIKEICAAQASIHWQLSTSRRTPDDFIDAATTLPNLSILQWRDSPPDWLQNQLALASQCWVTQDSVSMLYEALSAHCAVGLLELDTRRDNKISRNLRRLVAEGLVTPFSQWSKTLVLPANPHALAEHRRCARLILSRCPELGERP